MRLVIDLTKIDKKIWNTLEIDIKPKNVAEELDADISMRYVRKVSKGVSKISKTSVIAWKENNGEK